MAAEYEVNIKINAGRAEAQLRDIDSTVKKIGKTEKQTAKDTDRRVAALVKLRSIGNDVAALQKQGLDVSRAEFQIKKAGEAIEKKMFSAASARMGVAVKELNVQRGITKQLEQQEKARRREKGKRMEGVALGAGFPLLFGGGPGSVIGGAAGGLTGSFGAQIAFSAIGQQIDQFVAGVIEAGKAFTSVGGAAEFMAEKSLFSSDAMQHRIETLIEEGRATEAAALMTKEMAKQVGGSGLKALKDLGDEANKMGKLFNTLILQIQAFIAKGLAPLLAAINKVVGNLVTNNQFNALMEEATGDRAKEINEFLKPFTTKIGGQGGKEVRTRVSQEGKRLAIEKFGGQVIPEGAAIEPTQLELLRAADQGGGKAARKAAKEEERLQKRLDKLDVERRRVLSISRFKDKIAAAEATGNKQLVIRLKGEQKIEEIEASRLDALAGVTDQRERDAINIQKATEKLAAHRDVERELGELQRARQEKFKDTIEDLDHQLALARATTEEERERLRIERQLALLDKGGMEDSELAEVKTKLELLAQENTPLSLAVKGVREEINNLHDPVRQLISLSETVGSAFSESFRGIVSGSMTAREALANLFQRTANHFFDMAAQMISAQIRMKILGIGMNFFGGGATPMLGNTSTFSSAFSNPNFFTGMLPGGFGAQLPGRASGGPVGAGQPYMVGERGPELFVPGAQGNIIPNNAMGGTSIVVNVDASGSSVEGDADQSRQLGKLLGAAVQAELIKQKRPGGLLTV